MDPALFRWVEGCELSVDLAMTSTPTEWELGRIFKQKVRVHENFCYGIIETTGVCIATQITGPSPGQKAIVKSKYSM